MQSPVDELTALLQRFVRRQQVVGDLREALEKLVKVDEQEVVTKSRGYSCLAHDAVDVLQHRHVHGDGFKQVRHLQA